MYISVNNKTKNQQIFINVFLLFIFIYSSAEILTFITFELLQNSKTFDLQIDFFQ